MISNILTILINLLNIYFSQSQLLRQIEKTTILDDNFDLNQTIKLFETNYKMAKIDPNINKYKDYFLNKLNNSLTTNKNEYNETYLNYFKDIEKSYILFYKRNPVEDYKISFPNETYYLWRIKVKIFY